jgi:ribosomal protein S6--L-glutamate ligase
MNILILSRNPALYSTQSLYLAARRRRHEVRVVDHMRCDIVIERDKLDLFYEEERLHGIDAIIPRIGASATSYGAAVIRQFEMMGVFTAVKSEALLRSRDKRTSMQFLVGNGIRVPSSMIINNVHTIRAAIDHVGPPPVIIKLLNSTQGLGVILGETMNSAESIMEAFIKMRQKVILQEFIKEADGTDIRIFIVDGKIVASMERIAPPGEFRSNLHRGASARKIYLTEEERFMAKKAVQIMNLKVAGVDILRSKHGPMVLEVNASPGLEGIESVSGTDIAGKIIEYIERNAGKKMYST